MKLSTWKKKHSGDKLSDRAIREATTLEDDDGLRDAARAYFKAESELHDWIGSAWTTKK